MRQSAQYLLTFPHGDGWTRRRWSHRIAAKSARGAAPGGNFVRRLVAATFIALGLPSLSWAQSTAPASPSAAAPSAVAPSATTTPAATPPVATDQGTTVRLPEVDVIGTTPLQGSGVLRQDVPATTYIIDQKQLNTSPAPSALRTMDELIPGVTLNDQTGNPFQPDFSYRGFEASPLAGNPQGLAVYLNGVRFNQPFGDVVNWDLIPNAAIDQINLEGSNPVFGLNALGGSVAVRLKNGFTYTGGEVDAFGGSFGRVNGSLQYGAHSDNTAVYVALDGLTENGWRQGSDSVLRQFYGDIGWRSDKAEVHVNVAVADNRLNAPAFVPVQLLAVDRSADFTAPNLQTNKYLLTSVTANYDITDTTSLQALAYYSNLSSIVSNGNATNTTLCSANPGFLCEGDGTTPLTGLTFKPIPAFNGSGAYSQLNNQTTNTNGYGASAQVSSQDPVFGIPNQFVAGASFDGGQTLFAAETLIGGLYLPDRSFVGPGVYVDQADNSIAPARVLATNAYYGLYISDILKPVDKLAITLAARFNAANINLADQLGTALNGNDTFTHLNPAIGFTYDVLPGLTTYAGYAVSNRAPTPVELTCASPTSPCTLTNFFVGDPPLKQVIGQTIEAGLRGVVHPYEGAKLSWNAGVFRTDLQDDILFTASTTIGSGFFQNIGSTRRQGVEAGLNLTAGQYSAYVGYAYTDATFQTPFVESSPDNPGANAAGLIFIHPGDQLPGVPQQRLKFGASYQVTDAWTVGFNVIASSGQYLHGDEANLTPKTNPYVVFNFDTTYQLTPSIALVGMIENLFNAQYEVSGGFSPTSSVPIIQAPGATNTRSLAPAAPIAGYGGIRVTF